MYPITESVYAQKSNWQRRRGEAFPLSPPPPSFFRFLSINRFSCRILAPTLYRRHMCHKTCVFKALSLFTHREECRFMSVTISDFPDQCSPSCSPVILKYHSHSGEGKKPDSSVGQTTSLYVRILTQGKEKKPIPVLGV